MANLDRVPSRPHEPPMPDPLGYFLTWTTYGTWLPGDERGWVKPGKGVQLSDPILQLEAEARMTEDACRLDDEQRSLVEKTIADHCRIRGWQLHAVNCRTNHVHVVVSANRDPDDVRDQFKAWCTRRLKELERSRRESSALARPERPALARRERPALARRERPALARREQPALARPERPALARPEQPSLARPERPALARPEQPSLARRATVGAEKRTPESPIREKWWTEKGSRRRLWDEESLEAAIRYVQDGQ